MNEIKILPDESTTTTTWKVVISWAAMTISGFETFESASAWVLQFIIGMVNSVMGSQKDEAARLSSLLQKIPFTKE